MNLKNLHEFEKKFLSFKIKKYIRKNILKKKRENTEGK